MQSQGLSAVQVEDARKKYGANKLNEYKRKSFIKSFISNLNDPIIRVLIIALFINIIFMFPNINWFESGGIASSIIIATLVSTISEYSSENAFERLKENNKNAKCIAIRDGKEREIPTEEIVVGDLLIINAGELIYADGELIEGEISVDESALTGESIEVKKRAKSKLLKGSVISQGQGKMIACAVGESTYYGRVAKDLSSDTRPSPLKYRLSQLAKSISKLGYIFAALVALAYLFNVFLIDSRMVWSEVLQKLTNVKFLLSELLNALTLGISIVVVAVPEGLPMMITVVLSSNMKKMIRDNVLVRKMVGIETSGNINLLFTDKTGTLTEGKLRVKEIHTIDEKIVGLSSLKKSPKLEKYLTLCANYCNDASYDGKKAIGSDATDRAVLEYFIKAKPNATVLEKIHFDSDKKYSSAVIECEGQVHTLFKGAPEKIINNSSELLTSKGEKIKITDTYKGKLLSKLKNLADNSYRVVAVGVKTEINDTSLDKITFIGLLAIRDRIRKEVPSAIAQVTEAGVGVIMITGDNPDTARAIAKECGIISNKTNRSIVLTGTQLSNMSDEEISKILPQVAVIARALPSDKSRLVKISQQDGYIVGMTGDGINDAPSLKLADVGFAMGSGTDVAKEASDIVISNNNFASIVKSILYGRTIFQSIRKFIVFQLTMNLGAVGISLLGPFIGVENPVTITQMLWVNIIMDTLGALAFAKEPARAEYMKEKPKPRDEKILSSSMLKTVLLRGLFILALCVWFLKSDTLPMLLLRGDNKYILSAFFAMFIFMGIFTCFISRTTRINILSGISKNKAFVLIMLLISLMQISFIYFGGELFRATPLKLSDLFTVILISFTVVIFDFVIKLLNKRRKFKNKIKNHNGGKQNVK
ncbi:MAG: calcium-translocating P-type ATPase, PMCA-type [Clostridia bacterium]|nr:calcium-translocating P-type ATPase, PMCA-type [Clostridia bacterium]